MRLKTPFLALLLCLAPLGCEHPPQKPEGLAFVHFTNGSVGRSNDPLRFPKPGIGMMVPYTKLEEGWFVNRLDLIGFSYRFVLHQLIRRMPDGSWEMQGYNRVTNPRPDTERLTPENYWGVSFPINAP